MIIAASSWGWPLMLKHSSPPGQRRRVTSVVSEAGDTNTGSFSSFSLATIWYVLFQGVWGSNWPSHPLLHSGKLRLGLGAGSEVCYDLPRFVSDWCECRDNDHMTLWLNLECGDVLWMQSGFGGPVFHRAPFDLGQTVCSVTLWKVLHTQHICTQVHVCMNVVTGKSQVGLQKDRCPHVNCHSFLCFRFHSFLFVLIFPVTNV